MDAVLTFLLKYPSRVWERGDIVWSPVLPLWAYGRVTGLSRGHRSALGALQELAGTPLAGLIVVTDGSDNAGRELDPALLALKARRIPVYTVGAGEERFARDIAIERVSLPARPLSGANLLADVTLRLRGVAGERVTLTAEADGRVVATETVTLPATEETMRARLRLSELAPGTHRITVRTPALERESITENNEAHGLVKVREGPDRIIYREEVSTLAQRLLERGITKQDSAFGQIREALVAATRAGATALSRASNRA